MVKEFGSAAAVKEGGESSGAAAGVCFELVNHVEGEELGGAKRGA